MSEYSWRARWRVWRTPPIAIRDATVGSTVKVEGVVAAPAGHLVAPASGDPCIAYRLVIQLGHEQDGNPDLADETEAVSFEVRDGTASVRVDPLPCHYVTARWSARTLTEAPGAGSLGALLERYHLSHLLMAPRWRRPYLRVYEAALVEGARVAVFGTITGRPPASARWTYRESTQPGIGMWDGGALVIDDRSAAGHSLWAAARTLDWRAPTRRTRW
jgi:hypothetical protein